MNIGEKIRNIRKSKKMSMKKLGELIGTTESNISRYEKGIIKNIPLSNLEKIAQALSIEISELIDNNKNNTINNNILILESLNIIENEMLKIRKLIL